MAEALTIYASGDLEAAKLVVFCSPELFYRYYGSPARLPELATFIDPRITVATYEPPGDWYEKRVKVRQAEQELLVSRADLGRYRQEARRSSKTAQAEIEGPLCAQDAISQVVARTAAPIVLSVHDQEDDLVHPWKSELYSPATSQYLSQLKGQGPASYRRIVGLISDASYPRAKFQPLVQEGYQFQENISHGANPVLWSSWRVDRVLANVDVSVNLRRAHHDSLRKLAAARKQWAIELGTLQAEPEIEHIDNYQVLQGNPATHQYFEGTADPQSVEREHRLAEKIKFLDRVFTGNKLRNQSGALLVGVNLEGRYPVIGALHQCGDTSSLEPHAATVANVAFDNGGVSSPTHPQSTTTPKHVDLRIFAGQWQDLAANAGPGRTIADALVARVRTFLPAVRQWNMPEPLESLTHLATPKAHINPPIPGWRPTVSRDYRTSRNRTAPR